MKITSKRAMSALAMVAALTMGADTQAFWGSSSSGGSYGSSGGSYGSSGSSGGSRGSWGSSGSSGGSYGSHGSSGGSYGSSSSGGSYGSSSSGGSRGSWGSSGSHGSSGSSGGFVRVRRHRRHGSHGSSGGSYGSHGSSGGSHGSSGGGVIYESSPVYESDPVEVEVEYESQGASMRHPQYGTIVRTQRSTGNGTLLVNVPQEAKVFVNDTLTTSTGNERRFVSRGLTSGRDYSYTVRVEFERNGETVTETKAATLTAGSEVNLVFEPSQTGETVVESSEPAITESASTDLILNVPADAQVTLAGTATKQTGETRQFSTSRLAPGQTWENYTILVELEVEGRKIQQERTITLIGGESREEAFEFDAALLASR